MMAADYGLGSRASNARFTFGENYPVSFTQ
jgi:hypothetical protein